MALISSIKLTVLPWLQLRKNITEHKLPRARLSVSLHEFHGCFCAWKWEQTNFSSQDNKGIHLHWYWFLSVCFAIQAHRSPESIWTFRKKTKHGGKQERYVQWENVSLHTHTHMRFIWFRWLASGGRLIANKKQRKMHFLAVLIYSESASTAARNTKPQMCPHNRIGSRIQAKHKEVIKWDKFGGNDQGDSKLRLCSNVNEQRALDRNVNTADVKVIMSNNCSPEICHWKPYRSSASLWLKSFDAEWRTANSSHVWV